MAPAPGHLLVPAARRLLKHAINKTSSLIRSKFPSSSSSASNPTLEAIPIYVRSPYARQPTHPLAFLKQLRSGAYSQRFGSQNGRSFFSTVRSQSSSLSSAQARFAFQQSSRVGAAIAKSSHPRPFASTLRPNLTGGAIPRRAGGYTLGGARQFSSSTGGAQANVVRNVAQGFRAMVNGGMGVRYEGVDAVSGRRQWRQVGGVEDKVARKMNSAKVTSQPSYMQKQSQEKGTTLRFKLSPTITALSATSTTSISDATKPLQHDFAKVVREYIAINNEIKKLATIGDFPVGISYTSTGPVLEVKFLGCDKQTVENLCDELGIWRGIVVEDPEWMESRDVDMALLFPFAPSHTSGHMNAKPLYDDQYIQARDADSLISEDSHDDPDALLLQQQQYTPGTTTSFFGSGLPSDIILHEDGFSSSDEDEGAETLPSAVKQSGEVNSNNGSFEGVEGIFRFLRECDEMRR